MPIKVFGDSSSSQSGGSKIDTSLFVQKPWLKNIYIESNIEENNDSKVNLEFKSLPCPV